MAKVDTVEITFNCPDPSGPPCTAVCFNFTSANTLLTYMKAIGLEILKIDCIPAE